MCLQFLLFFARVALLASLMLKLLFFHVPVALSLAPSVDYNVTEQTHENITRIFDLILNKKNLTFSIS